MEWFFTQFYNSFYLERAKLVDRISSTQYKNIIIAERAARIQLLNWLKLESNQGIDDVNLLINLVESVPLSYVRLSTAFDVFLTDAEAKLDGSAKIPFLSEIFSQFTCFTAKTAVQTKLTELEQLTTNGIEMCKELINKHFDPIEKCVWTNRLTISNFNTIRKYTIHPIKTKYIYNLFTEANAPVYDLHVTFSLLCRIGYESSIHSQPPETDEFIQTSPERMEAAENCAKQHDDNIMETKNRLIAHIMAQRKNLKKCEEM